MTDATAHVELPQIAFSDATPIAQGFDDVYFSRDGGIAETQHVFVQGNGLPHRWAGCAQFTIGELGFGTGLNFLVAMRAFLAEAPAGARLHYVAIEKFPLTPDMLRAALALQPELAAEAALLLAAYPLRLPGIHRIHLPRVALTLCFGDVEALLPQLDMQADAWFLDGFTPAKNPAMWTETVMAQLARLSAPGATVATFTAAGSVKRGLMQAGFAMRKVDGFGHKRDMLVGMRADDETPRVTAKSAIVIGGGIAGCTVARALAERGVRVTLLERGAIAQGASGNAAAVLFPQLTKRWTASAAWYFTAYGFMLRQLLQWDAGHAAHQTIGMLRVPRHAQEEAQLRGLNATLGLDPAIVHWVEHEEASVLAGVALGTGGAWFPQGTWVAPGPLCRALLQHENITVCEQVAATSLQREGAFWEVTAQDGAIFAADICCVAAAHECATLLPEMGLTLHAVGGQVSEVNAADVVAPLRSMLCHRGYVIPHGDRYLIGATYNHDVDDCTVTDDNHARNLEDLATFLPGWLQGHACGGRMALRATTPDRLPYVGAVGEGLYVSTGHGSRGMLSAPLAAEVIASLILGEPVPLTQALRQVVDPLRFKKR
ncbi:MAG: bifunctional tRNA (5-methylaminomethyl-2-thiouridine)(34)-methyltransferase MnmD/FAD-dependent 5-carboxymethylaminomethyl-2-thiouridine(34) oxidoreductase MnmC [Pseudomonadota bacterium]